ncbi:hypothetical protein ATSB10_35540 [Dyella thiooxydans]|uniref:Uncharacterized protein n=1 Tax=Dyella thiooxydans TaxID=445710 RepID=A0A160N5N0_9GAMM|nr:hypothetical protein [Dyella thiooxydans]AND71008.1 hypothetical protein ATSB10_35540 [Dyella thiooxydans]
MNAPHWIVGSALAAALSLPALASAASSDLGGLNGGGQQSSSDSTSSRTLVNSTSASGGGDVTSLPQHTSASAPASSSSDADSDPTGNLPVSGSARQAAPHHASPGWQSLLPGSIQ